LEAEYTPAKGWGEPAGRRGDVQDPAGDSFPHGRQRRLPNPQRPQHVGRQHPLHQIGWHGLHRPTHRHSGIVDHHLHPPGRGHRLVDRRRIGEIQDQPFGSREIGHVRKPATGRDHLVVTAAQLVHQGAAQATGGVG
jgi:hypothetical protein